MLVAIVACSILIAIQLIESSNNKDNVLAYTDLIKQISNQNVEKVEMTTGSTTVKVTLKNKITDSEEKVKLRNR